MAGDVLDISALLAFVQHEREGETVLEILGKGVDGEVHEPTSDASDDDRPPLYLPFMTLMECGSRIADPHSPRWRRG